MKDCFCGWGRTVPKFPLGVRSVNKRGQQVAERIAWAEDRGAARDGAHGEWLQEGDLIVQEIAAATHGEADPRSLDEGVVRQWQAYGRDLLRAERQGTADLGRAVRESGLSTKDAADALGKAVSEGMDANDAVEALRRGELRP